MENKIQIPQWMSKWIEKFESAFDGIILLEPGIECPTILEMKALDSKPLDWSKKPATHEMDMHYFRAYSPPFSSVDAACAYVMGYLAGGNLLKIIDTANKSKVRVELLYRFPFEISQETDFMTRHEEYSARIRFTVAVGSLPLDISA